MLVCSGYCNEIPQTGWLNQQRFIFSQFQRLEVKIKAPSGLVSGGASLPGMQTAPSCCILTWPRPCVHAAGEPALWGLFLLHGHQPHWMRAPPLGLNTSLQFLFPNPVIVGVQDFNIWTVKAHNFVHCVTQESSSTSLCLNLLTCTMGIVTASA